MIVLDIFHVIVPHGTRVKTSEVSSQSRHHQEKKSTATLTLKDASSSSNLQRKSVQQTRVGGRDSINQSNTKSLQLQNPTSTSKNTNTPVNKKSLDVRGGKESHKKQSFVDREKVAGGKITDKKDGVTKVSGGRKQSSTETKRSVTQVKPGAKTGASKTPDLSDNIPAAGNKKEAKEGVGKKEVPSKSGTKSISGRDANVIVGKEVLPMARLV